MTRGRIETRNSPFLRRAHPCSRTLCRGVHDHATGLTTAKAEPIILKPDLDGVAQWGKTDDFQFLPFVKTHFQVPLDDGILALYRFDMGSLPDRQLVQRWHGITTVSTEGNSGGLIGENDASNQDLRRGARSEADPGTSKLKQTRSATAENLQAASR